MAPERRDRHHVTHQQENEDGHQHHLEADQREHAAPRAFQRIARQRHAQREESGGNGSIRQHAEHGAKDRVQAPAGDAPKTAGDEAQHDTIGGEVPEQLLRRPPDGESARGLEQCPVQHGGEPQDGGMDRQDHAERDRHLLAEVRERQRRSEKRQVAEARRHGGRRPARDVERGHHARHDRRRHPGDEEAAEEGDPQFPRCPLLGTHGGHRLEQEGRDGEVEDEERQTAARRGIEDPGAGEAIAQHDHAEDRQDGVEDRVHLVRHSM